MPGAATHTTIIQHLADLAHNGPNPNPEFQTFLTDPNLNADWATYGSPEALQARYAVLGAMGPDIFYLMLDYGAPQQQFEDIVVKLAGTFSCVGKLSGEINNLVNSTLDSLTDDVWKEIQASFTFLKGILVDSFLDLLVDQNNFWFFFLPLREVDDYRENWYWADFLHYVKTGCFTQRLLDSCREQQAANPNSATTRCLSAYALGYLTHYVADTIGHAYVNRIVESPWRNAWQRHHLVENFIDACVWASWHDRGGEPTGPGTEEQFLDSIKAQSADPMRNGAASLHYARLNDLCNIGSAGLDTTLDGIIGNVCDLIQQRLFDLKLSKVPKLQAPDDPIFLTWTQFMADAMWQTYSLTADHPSRLGRFPTSDDIAGAYGAYRLLLSLATEDDVDKPQPPDILGDLQSILSKLVASIKKDIGSIPPPPSEGGGSFSLDALAKAIKDYIGWLGKVAEAAVKVLGDLISALIQAGVAVAADTIKAGLYLLNTILYSIYHSLRMILVMSAYSVPFNEDLMGKWGPLDLETLWNASYDGSPQRYPIEPVVSERDFGSDAKNPYSPYRPYFRLSTLAPVNVESPATTFHPEILKWSSPDDVLSNGAPGIDNMFSAAGLAPAMTVPLLNPDGSKLTDLETFDGSQRYFGTIFDNCSTAFGFAIPYILGTPYPEGTTLPDYNLDSDRGFAWPCWDVDYEYQNPANPFPWNGADPFPADTIRRVNTPLIPFFPTTSGGPKLIDWGDNPPGPNATGLRSNPPLTTNDPWGSPRMGDAWVNATTLNPTGDCRYAGFPFPAIVVNARSPQLDELDRCDEEEQTNLDAPSYGLLSLDYQFAPDPFLHSNPDDPTSATDDILQVYLHLPSVQDPNPPLVEENDRRLADFLRALARTTNPQLILANAVSLALGNGTTPVDFDGRTITGPSPIPVNTDQERAYLVGAVAQLAVTGRASFEKFAKWAPTDDGLVQQVNHFFPGNGFDPARLQATAHSVLDMAYTALWAIRSNDPGWRAVRSQLGWIAVSGFDDTPHRPVNVPTAPYPQYDLEFDVPYPDPQKPGALTVTTRYMVASAHTFVGPDDPQMSVFRDPAPVLLAAPAEPIANPPAPRAIPPQDAPTIPTGNKIIIYTHGGGSRTEEAVDMASWLIVEGKKAGQDYTVISFDLPNSAYASAFDVKDIMAGTYDHHQRYVLQFEQRYIIAFIEKLDQVLGNVKGRIVAVMGGSLGGNMSLLMTDWYDKDHPYLQTIVAWSATAISPAKYLGFISAADVATYIKGQEGQIRDQQEGANDHATEAQYIHDMYANPLSGIREFFIPAQPIMWYRGGYAPDGHNGWQPCKDRSIARSRFDRYEIYSPHSRHWTIAIDLEQISFSFQEEKSHLKVVVTPPDGAPTPNLMLVAGEHDNFFPNAIYNSTLDLTRKIRMSAHGKAEFWLDTGHSFHNERPHLFASEIVYYLTHLDTGDSPYGVVVSTPPHADYSMEDR